MVQPSIVLARVEAERHRRLEREGRVLAHIVVGHRMAAFHRALLHGIKHLQAGNDFATGEHTDLELALGQFGNALGDEFTAAVDGVQALGKAGRHAPLDLRQALRQSGSGNGAGSGADSGGLQERTSFHRSPPGCFFLVPGFCARSP